MPARPTDTVHDPPSGMVMEPHTHCNLTCLSCLTGQGKLKRGVGKMPFSSFKRLVDEVSPWLKTVHWSGMGEPLLFADSLHYLAYLTSAGIQVRLDTNGHCFRNGDFAERLIQTGLSEINIAFDGIDQESLAAIRGAHASFPLLLEQVRLLLETRKRLCSRVKVNLQVIVSRPNEHCLGQIFDLGRDLHPDSMTIKTIRLDPKDRAACWKLMPRSAQYRQYVRPRGGTWRPKGKMLTRCLAVRAYCVVCWDGTLLPCCFDLDGKHAFGNVFDSSFQEAWHSARAVRFRQRASTKLSSIPMCRICPVGRDQDNCWEFGFEEDTPPDGLPRDSVLEVVEPSLLHGRSSGLALPGRAAPAHNSPAS